MDKTIWLDEAVRMKVDENLTWNEITKKLKHHFPDTMNDVHVYDTIRGNVRRTERYKEMQRGRNGAQGGIVSVVQEPPKPKKETVYQNLEPDVVSAKWGGRRTIRFALMGDTQINSKYTQLTHLHDFYDVCSRYGIDTVYHTGDIDEGEQMRTGHQYECYTQGADDHTDEIIRVYPMRTGIKTYFITGNHDASMIKHCGFDIGRAISEKRPDMSYLGRDCSVVQLTPNCSLELRHPWDGTAYAISYKMQKMIEAMQGGDKPNILAVGHYHKIEYISYRNVHAFQTGTFQAQTPWMRGKGIAAMMGGWIVEVDVDSDGSIRSIKQELIPYYKAIKDDYKNFSAR